jgi:hypothetical protein
MAEFIPISDTENPVVKLEKSAIDTAREAAEIQKYETERIELQRQAVFAQNDIKDTEDLRTRLNVVTERENKLAKDFMDFGNKKSIELSEVQKLKADLERRLAELVKREQDLSTRTKNVELREKLVVEREDLMNSVEKLKLEDDIKQNSLSERLKRTFPKIATLMRDNSDILDKAGFHNLADGLWVEVGTMEKWSQEGVDGHMEAMIAWLKEEVLDCNKKAVLMARNQNSYAKQDWDNIVDNLEDIYKLLSELKPPDLPSD